MNSIRRNSFQEESMLRATSAYKSAHHRWRGLEGFQICLCFCIKWIISGVSTPLPLLHCYCVFFFAFSHHIACLSQEESLSHCLPAWLASGVLCVLFCVCRHHLCLVHGWEVEGGSSQLTLSYAVQLATFYMAHWGITFPSTEPPSHRAALWPASYMRGDRFLSFASCLNSCASWKGKQRGQNTLLQILGFFLP